MIGLGVGLVTSLLQERHHPRPACRVPGVNDRDEGDEPVVELPDHERVPVGLPLAEVVVEGLLADGVLPERSFRCFDRPHPGPGLVGWRT